MVIFTWTIDNNREDRKEEHRLQVLPVISYDISDVRKNPPIKDCQCLFGGFPGVNKYSLSFIIKVKNIGLGAAQEIEFSDWFYQDHFWADTKELGTMLPGEKSEFKVVLDFPNENEYNQEIGQEILFSRKITYKDIFGNVYEQEVPFKFYFLSYWKNDVRHQMLSVNVVGLKQTIYPKQHEMR